MPDIYYMLDRYQVNPFKGYNSKYSVKVCYMAATCKVMLNQTDNFIHLLKIFTMLTIY